MQSFPLSLFVLVMFLKSLYPVPMLILGIDPGLQNTGWGLIHSEGHALRFHASGTIRTVPTDTLAHRLSSLHIELCKIIEQYSPDQAAVEETFVNKNPASALKLGQARGVILAVPGLYDIEVSEYSANRVKKSVVGSGHAAKQQIGMMIRTLLPASMKENGGQIGADEADALAVAICHAHYHPLSSRLNPARPLAAAGGMEGS